MPTYKIKTDSGVIDMPWEGVKPPTSYDIDSFIESSKAPPKSGIMDKIGEGWDKLNTPMVNYSPEMQKRMGEFSQAHPVLGGAGKFVADTVASGTSPLSVGLEGLGAISSLPGIASRIANPIRKGITGGLAAHGAYKTGEGIIKGDAPGAFAGGLEALGGALGYRGIHGAPLEAKMPTAINEVPSQVKPQLSLPEAPLSVTRPGFVVGDQGVAVPNRPIPVNSGTGIQTVPPDVAANYFQPKESLPPSPPSRGVDLGEVKEQNRQASLPGMSPETWEQIASGRGTLDIPTQPQPSSPPVSGDRSFGFNSQTNPTKSLGYPLDVVPNSVRPRSAQTVIGSQVPESIRSLPGEIGPVSDIPGEAKNVTPAKGKIKKVKDKVKNLLKNETGAVGSQEVFLSDSSPKQIERMKAKGYDYVGEEGGVHKFKFNNKPIANEITTPSAGDKTSQPDGQASREKAATSKSTKYRMIPDDATPETALNQWASGRQGAKLRGINIAKDFEDLNDPSLVDKYEFGDRSGRLADVQKHFDKWKDELTAAGVLQPDQSVENYLRHEFEQAPEEVGKKIQNYISKNPSIAKTRRFPSYSVAELAGLTRKYKTIPEIMRAYEEKANKALRTKELYDHLTKTKQIKKVPLETKPTDWSYIGENADKYKQLMTNIHSESSPGLKNTARVTKFMKNLYFGSGIPKTPLNMHYYNTMRSAGFARGVKGVGEFLSGTFSPEKDIAKLNSKKEFIADLVDHGYQTNIEDHDFANPGTKEKFNPKNWKDYPKKIEEFQGRVFEDPLFKIKLPAAKLDLAEHVYKNAKKLGKSEAEALTTAASVSNDFLGGINKNLRHANTKDLASIGLLAPDWLESRYNLAKKGVKALAGKENPIYAKAMARKAALRVAGGLATKAIVGRFFNPSDKSSNAANIPLGKTSQDKNRELPIFGTSAEEFRLPEEIAKAYRSKSESVPEKVSNLVTGRLSVPFRAANNIAFNKDSFGSPLYGKDRYGKRISTLKAAGNVGGEAAATVTSPIAKALFDLLMRKDPEQAISQGLELPQTYNTEPKNKTRKGMPSISLTRRRSSN